MKTTLRNLIPLLGLTVLASTLVAGEAAGPNQEIKTEKRVIVMSPGAPGANVNRTIEFIGNGPGEMEKVTFLGVQTEPVGPALQAQLGLPAGTGLAVNVLVPDSAAAGVLQAHDILLKFEDQILVNMEQLSVLVRNRQPGDKVKLTYLRGGKESTATVTLGEHEVPKRIGLRLESGATPGLAWHAAAPHLAGAPAAKEADKLLWMMNLGRGEDGTKRVIRTERTGDDMVFVSVDTGVGELKLQDEAGVLELIKNKDGKQLVAKDAEGETVFAGPVNTEEERAALPADLRARLEKLEAMPNMQFRTDAEFEGGEEKILRLPGREARLLRQPPPPGLRRLDVS
ncbi:MAG: PDZ domain-containing protein [Opitutaceae bacterium]|nr:PDZ domain-containing protein [Opitutaceae bacterium]